MAKVHLVQLDVRWEDATANRERAASLIHPAGVAPGDFVLLPEMFDTGFSFNTSVTADIGDLTLTFLREISVRYAATVQGGRTVAGPGRACRNVMSVVLPHGEEFEYAKRRLFPGEDAHLVPGRETPAFLWAGARLRVSPAICYDLRFAEVFRDGLRAGAEVFALGACWPSLRREHWRALLIARAIETQAFVLGCNRVGHDPAPPRGGGLSYAGGSIVIGPKGEVLGELGEEEGVLSVEIDAARAAEWRAAFPAWRAMMEYP